MAQTALSNSIGISGIGETDYSEGGGNAADQLALTAAEEAIADAGLDLGDVDGIIADSVHSKKSIEPGAVAEALGMDVEYTSLFEGGGGATYAGSPLLAAQAIQSGVAEHVLCYHGTEYATRMEENDPSEAGPYSYHTTQPIKANFEVPFGWVTQPVYMAGLARRHMHEHGTTKEHLGEVVTQTRENATGNARATKQRPLSLDEYLDTRPLAAPFSIHDCCLISDGAGAYVMSSAEYVADRPDESVLVSGVGVGYNDLKGSSALTQQPDYPATPATSSGPKAFEMAGLTPDDVDVAEIYDCFSVMVPIQLEDLGFCSPGEGGEFVQQVGITVADGDLPVNTHGGLLSQAYLHGMNHVVEAVRQLRRTADGQVAGADTALVAGWGGRSHATLLLERGDDDA